MNHNLYIDLLNNFLNTGRRQKWFKIQLRQNGLGGHAKNWKDWTKNKGTRSEKLEFF